MTVLVSRTKWLQSEVLQRQLLAHLETHFPLIFFAKTQLRGIVTCSDAKCGSGSEGKVEKLSNILKEKIILFECFYA